MGGPCLATQIFIWLTQTCEMPASVTFALPSELLSSSNLSHVQVRNGTAFITKIGSFDLELSVQVGERIDERQEEFTLFANLL